MENKKIVVAIDGHSSCGKSTMAKHLAGRVGYIYVDTGAMYRAVTLYAMREGMISASGTIDEQRLESSLDKIVITFCLNSSTNTPDTYLNDECVESLIRTIEVSQNVSQIAALPFVRQHLVVQQQRMGQDKGVVMDGRDVGTAIFPDAELKIFVSASAEVRARRRFDELQAKGMAADYEEILKNVTERDYIDSHREVNPLRQADDALLLDNSSMTIAEQNDWLYRAFSDKIEELFGRIKI